MNFNFSITKTPTDSLTLTPDAIYHMATNSNFHIPRKFITPQKYYFCITSSGNGEIVFDGETIYPQNREFILLQPQKTLSYRCVAEYWNFWWIEFFSSEDFYPIGKLQTIAALGTAENWLDQALRFAEQEQWDICAGLIATTLSFAYSECLVKEEPDNELAATIESYIRENISTVTVASICKHLDMNERTLRNFFYKRFGTSPKKHINNTRLMLAARLLDNSCLTLDQIAEQLGFSSRFHFSNSFRARYQYPPAQYRNRKRP